jgi:hypothetical protein
MAVYRGYRYKDAGPLVVTKDGVVLSPEPSQKVWNHSPDGFQWGYGGSGPAQLALALLLDVAGGSDEDKRLAVRLHQDFKRDFVCGWGDKWEMTTEEIQIWLAKKLREFIGNNRK